MPQEDHDPAPRSIVSSAIAQPIDFTSVSLSRRPCVDPWVNPPDGSVDLQERYQRGLISTLRSDPADDPSVAPVEVKRTAEWVGEHAYYVCRSRLQAGLADAGTYSPFGSCPAVPAPSGPDPLPSTPNTPASCGAAVCAANVEMCVADALVGLARGVDKLERLTIYEYGTEYEYTIPAQRAEANARLLEEASRWLGLAATMAGENLRAMDDYRIRNAAIEIMGRPPVAKCTPADANVKIERIVTIDGVEVHTGKTDLGDVVSYAENLQVQLASAYTLALEVSELVATTHAGIADAERSRNTSHSRATTLAWLDPMYSRSTAAHQLVGGAAEDGLLDFAEFWNGQPTGFCAMCSYDAKTLRAEALLRESGIHPRCALREPSEFFGACTWEEEPGLRDRLAALWNSPEVEDMTFDQFLDYVGLQESHFSAASLNVFMKAIAFPAPLNDVLKNFWTLAPGWHIVYPDTDYAGATTTYQRSQLPMYTAMTSDDHQVHPAYYAALLRTPIEPQTAATYDDHAGTTGHALLVPTAEYAQTSAAALIDYIGFVIKNVDRSFAALGQDRVVVSREAMEVTDAIPYRVHSCRDGNREGHVIYVAGNDAFDPDATAADDYDVVAGYSGLTCALLGSPATGGDCNMNILPVTRTPFDPIDPSLNAGAELFYSTIYDGGQYYLVKAREHGVKVPGGFEFIAVVSPRVIPTEGGEGEYDCEMIPVVRAVDRILQTLMTPSREDPSLPNTDCAGIPRDQKLALEDELTDDGSRYESSWRHYLDLARAAATRADDLGEKALGIGLEIEQRVELAVDDLEDECGGPVDIDLLLQNVFAGNTPNDVGTLCSDSGAYDATGTLRCVNGRWYQDPVATLETFADLHPASDALASCLQQSEVIDFVALGDQPLCLWRGVDDNTMCPAIASLADRPCPFIKDPDQTCEAQLGATLPPAYEVVSVTDTLGFIAESGEPASFTSEQRSELSLLCGDLREQRVAAASGGADPEVVESILARLDRDALQKIAADLVFRAKPFDHAEILSGAGFIGDTGSQIAGDEPRGGWPCEELRHWNGAPLAGCTYTSDAALTCMPALGAEACAADGPIGTTAERVARAEAIQRIGRAVLALKMITGVGLDGFYGPDIHLLSGRGWQLGSGGTLQNVDFVFGSDPTLHPGLQINEFNYRYCTNGGHPAVANFAESSYGGLSAGQRSVEDWGDPFDDECGSVLRGYKGAHGMGYCGNNCQNCRQDVWTLFDGGLPYAYQASCSAYGHSDPVRDVPLLIRDFGRSVQANNDVERSLARMWEGVAHRGPDGGTGPVANAVWTLVNGTDGNAYANVTSEYFGQVKWSGTYVTGDGQDYLVQRPIALAADGVTYNDVLDALELGCTVGDIEMAPACELGDLPEVSTISDLSSARRYMSCAAGAVVDAGRRMVLRRVPRDAFELAKGLESNGGLAQLDGERGVAINQLVAALTGIRRVPLQMATVLDSAAHAYDAVQQQLADNDIDRELAELQFRSAVTMASISGAQSALSTVTFGLGDAGNSFSPAGIAGLASAAASIAFATQEHNLAYERADNNEQSILSEFDASYRDVGTRIQDLAVSLDEDWASFEAATTSLENSRQRGQRALSRAGLFSTDANGRNLGVNTVLRRRFTTTQARYLDAFDYAKKMAFLAKLAIEQRLGIRLRELRAPMTLVDAPATWESTICTSTGIDYGRIRDATELSGENFADQYIGDYVDRLERVVESYRLDYPFQDSESTMVVSLRDDVYETRERCEIPSVNLLASSGNLATTVAVPVDDRRDEEEAWITKGCTPISYVEETINGPEQETTTWPCLSVSSAAGGPVLPIAEERGVTQSQRLVFQYVGLDPQTLCDPELDAQAYPPAVEPGCVMTSFTPQARLSQWVDVQPGRYLISWHGRPVLDSIGNLSLDPARVVRVRNVAGEELAVGPVEQSPTPDDGGWTRYWTYFEIDRTQRAFVELVFDPTAPPMVTMSSEPDRMVDLAALMLERIPDFVSGAVSLEPRLYVRSTLRGFGLSPVGCEDTDGSEFRARARRGCDRLCPDGFAGGCHPRDAETKCYWAFDFPVTTSAMGKSSFLERAGFALGNYNYRIQSIAVNLVGSGIVDCSASEFPSTCYARGFVPFSIEHQGPYYVRNHSGEDVISHLFSGRIQHGHALTSERYITNPISSADNALLSQYMHHELRGRPLSGYYTIKIWDTPDVLIEGPDGRLEDIQLILDYGYWTRFGD